MLLARPTFAATTLLRSHAKPPAGPGTPGTAPAAPAPLVAAGAPPVALLERIHTPTGRGPGGNQR